MKFYTGNYANAKKYRESGLFLLGISVSANWFNGEMYRTLAPTPRMLKMNIPEYIPEFKKILDKLDPDTVIQEIFAITKGKDVVMMCHEKEGEFCHRQMVAEWLENHVKENHPEKEFEVRELGKMDKPKSKIPIQTMMF